MGSMSASDAAPLPRLGEVYFDVRGESRSMRLSWYADTGVAVFSIWQGGTCTGTFRLPIADLPRMIGALQRGPHGDARAPANPLDGPRGATAPRGGPGIQDRTGQQGTSGYGRGPGPGVHRGGPLAGGYRDEPGGGYREGLEDDPLAGGYRRAPAASGYRDDPPGGHAEDRRARNYRDDALAGGYHQDDALAGGYGDDAPAGGDQDDRFTRRYQDDPLAGGYHQDDPLGGDQDDRFTRRYQDDPPVGGYHQDDPLAGGYRDGAPTGGYPADPLGAGELGDQFTRNHGDEPRGGRRPGQRGGGYLEAQPAGDYADDPLTGPYPEERDLPGNAGYSPARPYVAPLPGGTGGPPEGGRHGRGRPADREESDPSPDSFPYGHPSAEPEVRGRGR